MPWKLILYVIVLGVVLAFVGLNIGNQSDISFGFVVYENVPIFLSLFGAFFVGIVVALPIAVHTASRKARVEAERRFNKKLEREARVQQKLERKSRKQQESGPVGGTTETAATQESGESGQST